MLITSPKELALLIMNQRKKLKLSQASVGKLVGLKQQTISEFEKKPNGTRIETLFRILSALNLDIQLTTKSEQSPSKKQWDEQW